MHVDTMSWCCASEFREVLRWPIERLEQALAGDDARYRVWAAWSLGLQKGEQAAPEVRAALQREQVAGVRRHLLVMLAGWGEVDVVAMLARHDVDAYVRATAAQYVASLAAAEPLLYEVLVQCLDDGAAQVVAAAARSCPHDAPSAVIEELGRLLSDPRRDVRAACVAWFSSQPSFAPRMCDHYRRESDREIREHILEALQAHSPQMAETLHETKPAPAPREEVGALQPWRG